MGRFDNLSAAEAADYVSLSAQRSDETHDQWTTRVKQLEADYAARSAAAEPAPAPAPDVSTDPVTGNDTSVGPAGY